MDVGLVELEVGILALCRLNARFGSLLRLKTTEAGPVVKLSAYKRHTFRIIPILGHARLPQFVSLFSRRPLEP